MTNDGIVGEVSVLCQSCGHPFAEIFSHPDIDETMSFFWRSDSDITHNGLNVSGTCEKCKKPWYFRSNFPEDVVEPCEY